MKRIKTLTIDRRVWGRGVEGGRLRRSAKDKIAPNKMCCLGVACLAFGITSKQIVKKGMPYELSKKAQVLLPEWLRDTITTPDTGALSMINDSTNSEDSFKEKSITDIFAKHGIKVKFIN